MAEFLRLSKYSRRLILKVYERSIRFEEGLRYDLRVLIAPQSKGVFTTLVDKAKIAKEVKHTERERRD